MTLASSGLAETPFSQGKSGQKFRIRILYSLHAVVQPVPGLPIARMNLSDVSANPGSRVSMTRRQKQESLQQACQLNVSHLLR